MCNFFHDELANHVVGLSLLSPWFLVVIDRIYVVKVVVLLLSQRDMR